MKATTSYHDLIGKIEADISYSLTSEHNPKLADALKGYGIYPGKFHAVGLYFHSGYKKRKGNIEITVFLEDLNDNKKLKKKRMTFSVREFFGLFQQLNFLLMNQFYQHEGIIMDHLEEIDEDLDDEALTKDELLKLVKEKYSEVDQLFVEIDSHMAAGLSLEQIEDSMDESDTFGEFIKSLDEKKYG